MRPPRRNRNAPIPLTPSLVETVRAGGPFDSLRALEEGLVTRYALASKFTQYLPGIYVAPGKDLTQWERIVAVGSWARTGSVIGGWSAAHLLGEHYISGDHRYRCVDVYSAGVPHAPVMVRWRRIRRTFPDHDLACTAGITHTSAARTSVDVARWMITEKPGTRDERVISAIDSICNSTGTSIDDVAATADRMRGMHGVKRVASLLPDCDHRAGSPQESLLRRSIALSHLPPPVSQLEIRDASGRKVATPDLAYEREKVAIFYDGHVHGGPDQWRWDLRVNAALADLGWEVVRITKGMTPEEVIRHIDRALHRSRLKRGA